MTEYKWKTKSGEIMLISEMTDSHLLNAIAYLKRETPKGAEDYIEIPSFDEMTEVHILNRKDLLYYRGYYKLLAEKRRRKI